MEKTSVKGLDSLSPYVEKIAKNVSKELEKEGLKVVKEIFPDELRTQKEATDFFRGVSISTLNRWEKDGILKSVMIVGRKYYHLSELMRAAQIK